MSDTDEFLELAQGVFDGLTEAEITEVVRMALRCDEPGGRKMDADTGNNPYGVRECRGHYHVTCELGDVMLPGDPFPTPNKAQAAMRSLFGGVTEPSTTEDLRREEEKEQGEDA